MSETRINNPSETVDEAWKRVYGSDWTANNMACIHFHNGWLARVGE